MAEVTVVEQGTGTYIVTVGEGPRTTTHTVGVPAGLPATLGCGTVPVIELVRWSFAFLLEREPPASILRRVSLEQIGDYFPDYQPAIRRALGSEPGP
jgi:hypothetical protein